MGAMHKIKHIAILAKDQEKTVEFYKQTFGMYEVWRHNNGEDPKRYAVYLSDGYINLAVLPARDGVQEGINHFGFEVDDIDATARVAETVGATQMPEVTPRDGRFAEAFIKDPNGARVDLSVAGWRTEPAENPEYASARS